MSKILILSFTVLTISVPLFNIAFILSSNNLSPVLIVFLFICLIAWMDLINSYLIFLPDPWSIFRVFFILFLQHFDYSVVVLILYFNFSYSSSDLCLKMLSTICLWSTFLFLYLIACFFFFVLLSSGYSSVMSHFLEIYQLLFSEIKCSPFVFYSISFRLITSHNHLRYYYPIYIKCYSVFFN